MDWEQILSGAYLDAHARRPGSVPMSYVNYANMVANRRHQRLFGKGVRTEQDAAKEIPLPRKPVYAGVQLWDGGGSVNGESYGSPPVLWGVGDSKQKFGVPDRGHLLSLLMGQ